MPLPNPLVIVVVDDNIDNADTLAMLIDLWGYSGYVCRNRDEVIECCWKQCPDVVLLDLGLPKREDGLGLILEIRCNPRLLNTIIIAITGYADDEIRRSAKTSGADHFFAKPVDPELLQAMLAKYQLHKDKAPGIAGD